MRSIHLTYKILFLAIFLGGPPHFFVLHFVGGSRESRADLFPAKSPPFHDFGDPNFSGNAPPLLHPSVHVVFHGEQKKGDGSDGMDRMGWMDPAIQIPQDPIKKPSG